MIGFIVLIVSLIITNVMLIVAKDVCKVAEPRCPNHDVRFFYYTKDTQNDPKELSLFDSDAILQTDFIPHRPLIVLLHGYTGHKDYAPNPYIRPAYFEKGEYNIISLDYHPLAPYPCYFNAVGNLPVVANCTAQLLDFLVQNKKVEFDDIHVIGFSLGGQTAGMIANFIRSGKLKRITGLDPAKPMFVTAPPQSKLDKEDAQFVDVIHTDVLQRGVLHPSGHVDFYVNGGLEQTGCMIQNPHDIGGCNHDRAPKYYAESINSVEGFWGFRCAHWYLYALGVCHEERDSAKALMGFPADEKKQGLYFLTTNAVPPYARGDNVTTNNVIQMMDEKIQEGYNSI